MKLTNSTAGIFVPDGLLAEQAMARVTHLAIGAHQDDLEIMAFHGIKLCYNSPDQWFGGVVCTRGGGSPRTGRYADVSDDEMWRLRKYEQESAARIGKYGFLAQLDFTSSEVRSPNNIILEKELAEIIARVKPQVIYTHNLADKHDSHIGVGVSVIHALRCLPPEARPSAFYGCEVWRGLDWLADEDKIRMDVGGLDNISSALVALFDSQISGGKRYDLAVMGRRRSNATFFNSHETDGAEHVWLAMDLTPLIRDDGQDIITFIHSHTEKFKNEVESRLKRKLGMTG